MASSSRSKKSLHLQSFTAAARRIVDHLYGRPKGQCSEGFAQGIAQVAGH